MSILNSPIARLIGRAVLVALISAVTQLNQAGETIAWRAILTGAVLAAFEVLTPLNSTVGVGKKP